MKTKITPVFAATLLASSMLAPLTAVRAQSVAINASTTIVVGGGNATSSAAKNTGVGATTSATASTNADASTPKRSDDSASVTARVNGQLTAEAHRSSVAAFVRSLLSVANREGGIGAQVRVVAQSQMDSASTSARAMMNIENRSKVKTFFLGSDYKSLGQLWSETVVTQNNIATLETLRDSATSAEAKAELSAQIEVLEDTQADLEAYVEAHEDSFSLFGWFVKWFS